MNKAFVFPLKPTSWYDLIGHCREGKFKIISQFKPITNTASTFSLPIFFNFSEHPKPVFRESSGESLILQPQARKWSLCSSPDPNMPSSPCPFPLGFIHLIARTLDDRESRYCWPQITQKALLQIWDSLLSLPFSELSQGHTYFFFYTSDSFVGKLATEGISTKVSEWDKIHWHLLSQCLFR